MKTDSSHLDMVVVGAGFAGLYQLYKARRAGLRVKAIEAGDGVGGTWYWNQYPGARCDVESLDYSYSFSKELEQEWDWSERYATQPEILRYLNHVADRFDLRRDIQFDARVATAHFNDDTHRWTVTTQAGEVYEAQYLVMATGGLSAPQKPSLPHLDAFAGTWYHSAQWPKEGVDFSGKKVGLIGTGSSGVQMAPLIAEQAASLTVFQRTANFSVPAENTPIGADELRMAKENYSQRRSIALESYGGSNLPANPLTAKEMTEEERRAEMEHRWRGAGGGHRMQRVFADVMTDTTTNKLVADFVRSKIRETVIAPRVAELLCPKEDLPFGAKRLCVDSNYYETFNRDNVTLVDLVADPLVGATQRGLQTADREHELDVIVFATGFDAMTGALLAIDIRGAQGQPLRDKWASGPATYLGMSVSGFPNLFIITGPGSPSVLTNVVHSIEAHVNWTMALIEQARHNGVTRIEATPEAEQAWVEKCAQAATTTLYAKADSWYWGANIPGKPRVFLAYVGGAPAYRAILESVSANGYHGFQLSAPASA